MCRECRGLVILLIYHASFRSRVLLLSVENDASGYRRRGTAETREQDLSTAKGVFSFVLASFVFGYGLVVACICHATCAPSWRGSGCLHAPANPPDYEFLLLFTSQGPD